MFADQDVREAGIRHRAGLARDRIAAASLKDVLAWRRRYGRLPLAMPGWKSDKTLDLLLALPVKRGKPSSRVTCRQMKPDSGRQGARETVPDALS